MYIHDINPVLLNLGPLEIRYYGLFYVIGFLITYFMLSYLAKRKQISISRDDIADLLLYVAIGMLIGSRLFYALVYNFGYYMESPLKVFAIWEGGLSFHGALLGIITSGYIFCKKKKFDFYTLADIIVIPASLALMLGRIGNFINGELYGRITNVPWAVKFPDAEGYRHPSQLYEASKNLVMFIVLYGINGKNLPRGFMFWLFVTMYGSFRFLIEFFREPDPQLGYFFNYFTMGQFLTFAMFLFGSFMIYRVTRKAA